MRRVIITKIIQLYVYQMRQDDQRKCTAAKLHRLGLVKQIFRRNAIPKNGITLNPKVEDIFSPQEKQHLSYGLVAIDCSWKRVNEVYIKKFKGLNRRLPLLIASNPVNYGKISMLSSVEALASALYISDFLEQSEKLLSIFKWGLNFIQLNKDPLEDYRLAKNSKEILEIEKEYFYRNS